jgi:hypothetical protein
VIAWLQLRRVLVIVLALGLFAMAARNVTDPDVWWHLRTGELISQTHSFVHTDQYSFTQQGRRWVNHEWLSDLLLYGVYGATGWGGLIVVFAAITSLTLMLAFFRSPGKPYVAALALVIGAYASAPGWGVRPHTISLLLASIFLLVLERSEEKQKLLWWLIPLTLLWVNLHAEYALGIALIGIFLAGESAEAVLDIRPQSRARLRALGMTLVASLAVVPLNPNGPLMYSYPLETLRSPAMQQYIAEWGSPNFHEAKYLPFALMLLGILLLLSVSRARVRARDLLLLVVLTAGALRSVRHISVFVLAALPIASGLAQNWWSEQGRRARRVPSITGAKLAVNATVVAAFLIFSIVRVRTVVAHQEQSEAENFPAAAASFLASHHLPGPIFNHYNFGGYFIWKLHPSYPVYIDGRADLYGDQFLHDFAKTYYVTDDNWEAPFRQWNIKTVVLPPDAPLVAALQLTHDWSEVYSDSEAVILTGRLSP